MPETITKLRVCVALISCSLGAWAAAQEQKLTASDGAPQDYLGFAVGLWEDHCVVGARRDDTADSDAGAAYVYQRVGAMWLEQAQLLPHDASGGQQFGMSVAIQGEMIVVGSTRDNDLGFESGSAYVYKNDGVSWSFDQKLTADGGMANSGFGRRVRLDGELLAVSAHFADFNVTDSGAVFVFRDDGLAFRQEQMLVAANPGAGDIFGHSLDISSNTIIVGARSKDVRGTDSGAAYVFEYDGVSWSQRQSLIGSNTAAGDFFGDDVAIAGDTLVVGAGKADFNGSNLGAAYVFEKIDGVWNEIAFLTPPNPIADSFFGASVAFDGHTIAIGAFHEHNWQGAVYLYQKVGNEWTLVAKHIANDALPHSQFGRSVSLFGDALATGADLEDQQARDAGAAYVIEGIGPCLVDVNIDGRLNIQDFVLFLNAYSAGEQLADFNSDGIINTLDFITFLNAYNVGCSGF